MIALSTLLATLSWKFVEQPFRYLPLAGNGKYQILGGAAIVLVLLAAFNSIGFVHQFKSDDAVETATAQKKGEPVWREGSCFFLGGFDPQRWNEERCRLSNGTGPKVLLWGDSFAAHYMPGVEASASTMKASLYQYTAAGCPPVIGYYSYARPWCTAFNDNVLKIIDDGHFDAVILSARWIDMRTRGVDRFDATLGHLKKRNVKVFVIGQSPLFLVDAKAVYYLKGHGAANAYWPPAVGPDLNEEIRQTVEAKSDRDISFIDPITAMCKKFEECPYFSDGKFIFSDSGHYSLFGSSLAVKNYFPFQ